MVAQSRRTTIKAAAGMLSYALTPAGCAAEEEMKPTPRLNQLGFLPGRPKRFVLGCAANPAGPPAFTIEALNGARVFDGNVGAPVHDLTRTAGEHVRVGDFTAFNKLGRYRVRVGTTVSHPFEIGDAIYAPLVRDAARAFYLIRANVAHDDPVTGIRHAAGHLSEAALPVNGTPRDLTGGWYNAGDYGKWTHMAAISASHMMWLEELRPVAGGRLKLAVPQTFPGLPDLLQQARWGLEWLLKMQNPDGSVLHKIDASEHYASGSPDQDMFPRAVYAASSLDAGNFTGVMLQASRAFASFDRGFATRCRAAAQRAWQWLEGHPSVLKKDVNYLDLDPRQEIAWGIFAMAGATGDAELAQRAKASLKAVGVFPLSWQAPQLLGAMSLALSASPSHDAARGAITTAADAVTDRVDADPYGFSADPDDYYWGSNEAALNAAVLCLFAAELSDQQRFRDTAQRLIDYVLGCNTLDLSFVTGHGERSVRRPYHWTYRVWGIVMPGWASGGANHLPEAVDPLLKAVIDSGTPPARCFVDACEPNGSWGSNEGQTSENAALILATGLFGLRSSHRDDMRTF
jgi:endoglucanase